MRRDAPCNRIAIPNRGCLVLFDLIRSPVLLVVAVATFAAPVSGALLPIV
jgi:hypothetical protein